MALRVAGAEEATYRAWFTLRDDAKETPAQFAFKAGHQAANRRVLEHAIRAGVSIPADCLIMPLPLREECRSEGAASGRRAGVGLAGYGCHLAFSAWCVALLGPEEVVCRMHDGHLPQLAYRVAPASQRNAFLAV